MRESIDQSSVNLGGAAENVKGAQANIESAKPHTSDVGKAYLASAAQRLFSALGNIASADAANAEAKSRLDEVEALLLKLRGELDGKTSRVSELEASFFSVRQKRLIRWFVIGLAAMTLLRVVGLAHTGWLGTIAAMAGTALNGVLSGGLSLVQSLFDNLWFRWRAKKNQPHGRAAHATGGA